MTLVCNNYVSHFIRSYRETIAFYQRFWSFLRKHKRSSWLCPPSYLVYHWRSSPESIFFCAYRIMYGRVCCLLFCFWSGTDYVKSKSSVILLKKARRKNIIFWNAWLQKIPEGKRNILPMLLKHSSSLIGHACSLSKCKGEGNQYFWPIFLGAFFCILLWLRWSGY